jgi:ribose transport system ATP-binding protein
LTNSLSPPARLSMVDVFKRFGSTQALRGVSLEVLPGEVHALVGENGAGKSTLMKILSGAERPDQGHMLLDGAPYHPANPQEARRRGVAMIYQELALAPHLDVESNVMLGMEERRWSFVRHRCQRPRVEAALALLHHPEIRPETIVARLGPGARQLVEVARALVGAARIIVLDEPTSSLSRQDAEHLFSVIHRLKADGVAVVYISHFLEEVQQVADRFTVLRDGRTAGIGMVAGTPAALIIEKMVGQSLEELYPRVPHDIGPPVLRVESLAGQRAPLAVDVTLHRGEILGVFGLIGAGRTEFLRVLFGLEPAVAGRVELGGHSRRQATPRQQIRAGVGLLSEDRKHEGLALSQSVGDNLTYSHLAPYARWGWLHLRRRRAAVAQWLARLQIRCQGPEQPVRELSGGNQQKVALGRLLHQGAQILLLDEPTRGVDVASKAEIYRRIGELAREGKSVILVSSYLPELLGVCDRLAVMSRGRLGAPRAVKDWSAEQVMAAATGGVVP